MNTITEEQAVAIYSWRAVEGCTWRMLAVKFCETYPEAAEELGINYGNQIDGRELLNEALDILGVVDDPGDL